MYRTHVAPSPGALLAIAAPLAIGACGGATGSTSLPAARQHPTSRQAALRAAVAPARASEVVIGHSVRGRAILAHVVGSPAAERRILIVGCVHGNERAGEAVTRRLGSVTPPARTALWLVDEFNPDGCRADTRQNARGVDLNRNSPWHWQPLEQPGGTFYSGPGALSEPESRAINRLVRRLRPAVSVWYHEHASLVDDSSGGSLAIERRYARLVGLPLRSYGVFPGSITGWQDAAYPHDTGFMVELPAGSLPASSVARHVAAVLALSWGVARVAPTAPRRTRDGGRSAAGIVRSAVRCEHRAQEAKDRCVVDSQRRPGRREEWANVREGVEIAASEERPHEARKFG